MPTRARSSGPRGATESNNLALKGAAHFYKTKGKHLITVKTEHKAVLDTMRELERQGFEVTYLDVQEDGLLDLDVLKAAIRPDTILVSVMFVNNEIGVIQDIAAIGALCREKGIIFHVDAAQATGKVEIDLQDAAGRPDEPDLAQDLRPQGHRRAVRAPQAARAPGSADARRRPRARHALAAPCRRTRSWAWARPTASPRPKWRRTTPSASARCTTACWPA